MLQSPPTKGKKKWLLGASVWASWSGRPGPLDLYDFMGTNGGYLWFSSRLNKGARIAYTLPQLMHLGEIGAFRPFLINSDRIGPGLFIAEEE